MASAGASMSHSLSTAGANVAGKVEMGAQLLSTAGANVASKAEKGGQLLFGSDAVSDAGSDWSEDAPDSVVATPQESHDVGQAAQKPPANILHLQNQPPKPPLVKAADHSRGSVLTRLTSRRASSAVGSAPVKGVVVVKVLRGRALKAVNRSGGASDPYVKLVVGARTAKTKYMPNTLDPEWNETLQLDVDDARTPLRLQVWDEETFGLNQAIGDAEISFQELKADADVLTKMTLTLQHVETGSIDVEVTWHPEAGDPSARLVVMCGLPAAKAAMLHAKVCMYSTPRCRWLPGLRAKDRIAHNLLCVYAKGLLGKGAHASYADAATGMTALHFACSLGHSAVASMLLQAGAEVDAQDAEGVAPLHHASRLGHLELVKALLLHVAKADLANVHGVLPWQVACAEGHTAVMEFLLEDPKHRCSAAISTPTSFKSLACCPLQ